jgi:hypothetical protein
VPHELAPGDDGPFFEDTSASDQAHGHDILLAQEQAFDQLRTDTHALMRAEYAHRMATDPTPTSREVALGMYAENLEPQVREATFRMREKGYPTTASGFFYGHGGPWRIIGIEGEDVPRGTYAAYRDPVNKRAQTMDFHGMELDQATINSLAGLGAEVVRHPVDGLIYRIGFVPDTPDLDAITAQWGAVASVLPEMGAPVPPAANFNPGFADWGATAP